jgi:1,4-alpha-glucan branching enzyme
MTNIQSNRKRGRRKVVFSFDFPSADQVILMGDFNQWNPKVHPMKKDSSGMWKKTTMLYPGRYEYRFQVDGQWKNDPANHRMCLNRFGTYNNVVIVSAVQSSK